MSRRVVGTAAVAAIGIAALALSTVSAAASSPAPRTLTAGPAGAVARTSTVTAAKSDSGQRAQSDPALLRRTDSRPVDVVVKLDYDAVASYTGGLRGLAATSPKVTGHRLTGRSSAEVAYTRYATGVEGSFRAALTRRLPDARVGTALRTVYGGLAVRLPADQARTLLSLPGVAAVQADSLRHPDATPAPADSTVESPTFINAPALWKRENGQSLAGRGTIFADLDTGIWPEHPMLADNPALGTPPAAPSGKPRACNFGDNPLTPAVDVYQCNHKVIGGQPFLATYNANNTGEVYPDSARDSDGHGTHTTTTAAGDPVTQAVDLGVDRGPISGVAPGAWVIEYKVCGVTGCFASDSAAAVQQAIKDGANVINFSIGGGTSPYSDPAELAFLDAYNAGITVAASAGNSGPGAGTTEHRGPWTITVAASTQRRAFTSTLTVASGSTSATFEGTTLTPGVTTPAPIVLAANIAGYADKYCGTPMPAGLATGKLVVCERGGTLNGEAVGRIQKGYDVKQGGAVGMILYNPVLADTESDNHWLPAIHLADGTEFLAFLAAHPGATGSFPAGQKTNGQGDVMAAFSSRGPGGQFLKPDITAPGVQILAGNTPTPDEIALGPGGQYYQAIAGTSMSSPHIAGSALLVKALHPGFTAGQVKSALMTTATTNVVKEDLVTPADPFDMGSGRVDLARAGDAPVTFDETAAAMVAKGTDPRTAVDLNLPSVNLPTMPGTVTVTRTATNVTGQDYPFVVRTKAPRGSTITVKPAAGKIRPGQSQTFSITVDSNAPAGQYFGQIALVGNGKTPTVHLPVAFANAQGDVTLAQACAPPSLAVGAATKCDVTVQNNGAEDAAVAATSTVDQGLRITGATGAKIVGNGRGATAGPTVLSAPKDAIPAIAPGETPGGGFIDLAQFDIKPTAIGDEEAQNYTVPSFDFGGRTFSKIGVVSDGYLVLGGTNGQQDVSFAPQKLPDPARPNGVLAPYWTDLDGKGTPGIRVGVLSDKQTGDSWTVVQWDVNIYGTSDRRTMQVWLGDNGTEDISYAYADATIGKDAPADPGLAIGVENVTGTRAATISGPPTGSYVVTTTPGVPGETLKYSLTVKAGQAGAHALTTVIDTDAVNGRTRVVTPIRVR